MGGIPLIERVVSRLAVFQSEINIVTTGQSSFRADFNYPRLNMLSDLYPNGGSAGGIYTGLSFSHSFHNIVVACDMPFLNTELLKYMIKIQEGYDLVVFRNQSFFEPLHAIYSKNCLPYLEKIIHNNLRIIELVKYVKVRYLSLAEIESFDSKHLSFFNINTELDLKVANQIANGAELDFKVDLGSTCACRQDHQPISNPCLE